MTQRGGNVNGVRALGLIAFHYCCATSAVIVAA